MIVLGFDTATHATAVGLRLDGDRVLQARDDPAAAEHPGHATRLLAMAQELLAQAEIGWDRVERIAVGRGPGRFTGLRVGIATARALAQSLRVELVGVSSLRALALGAALRQSAPRARIAMIDARRGEVFAAAYAAGAEPSSSPTAESPVPRPAETDFPTPLRADGLAGIVAEIERLGGPRGERWQALGDGALLYADRLALAGVEVPPAGSPLHLIDGAAVCALGAAASVDSSAGERLLPDYRRSPDAALARDRALALRASP